MGWFPVVVHWDQANLDSIAKHGIKMEECEELVRSLAVHPEVNIWLDVVGTKKEWHGGKRFVCVLRQVSSGRDIVFCFTIRYARLRGLPKVVRPISIRFAHDRDPLLRETPPKRFVRAPSLIEILHP